MVQTRAPILTSKDERAVMLRIWAGMTRQSSVRSRHVASMPEGVAEYGYDLVMPRQGACWDVTHSPFCD